MNASRAEVCVVACAEAFRGDGEILAAGVGGAVTVLAARLARLTFEPDLITTDGTCLLTGDVPPLGADPEVIEGWLPFRDHLWLVLHGRRHVMLGASQIDRHGNTNISCIGDWARPTSQLLGVRGAPGNTVCNPTSYWIPRHSTRVFVPKVDMVSGVGHDRAGSLRHHELRHHKLRHHELRRVVTNLCVLDFDGGLMRLVSVHPGVSVADVAGNTGFPLIVPDQVPETRLPTTEELHIIRDILDPGDLREREVRA
ncbi:CoA-transferase subunit beta [Planotetraspora sp. GP83]|uniref:CoA-transferase subunit beta n=1 Tax=Planotetraspora sp. GP83 TaxID=3156264 RepID=UPI0035158BBA